MTGDELVLCFGVGGLEMGHGIYARVTHVVDGVVVFFLEEGNLEGEDGEKLVHVALDVLDAVLLPRPYFG